MESDAKRMHCGEIQPKSVLFIPIKREKGWHILSGSVVRPGMYRVDAVLTNGRIVRVVDSVAGLSRLSIEVLPQSALTSGHGFGGI